MVKKSLMHLRETGYLWFRLGNMGEATSMHLKTRYAWQQYLDRLKFQQYANTMYWNWYRNNFVERIAALEEKPTQQKPIGVGSLHFWSLGDLVQRYFKTQKASAGISGGARSRAVSLLKTGKRIKSTFNVFSHQWVHVWTSCPGMETLHCYGFGDLIWGLLSHHWRGKGIPMLTKTSCRIMSGSLPARWSSESAWYSRTMTRKHQRKPATKILLEWSSQSPDIKHVKMLRNELVRVAHTRQSELRNDQKPLNIEQVWSGATENQLCQIRFDQLIDFNASLTLCSNI